MISNINFKVYIQGRYAGDGTISDSYTIASHQTLSIKVDFKADFSTAGEIVIQFLKNFDFKSTVAENLDITLVGSASVTTDTQTKIISFGETPTAPINYNLTTSVNPPGAGSISPSGGQYSAGASVTLTATPATGYKFDSWSGDASGTSSSITISMNSNKNIVANFSVLPLPLSVNFDGWYVGGIKVTTANKGTTVTARILLSGGSPGQYTMRIRRDVALGDDTTVSENTFSYSGTSVTKEMSFSPSYATNEASTNGYHVDLTKDGAEVWTLTNSYPPRLSVTAPIVTYSLSVTVNPAGGGSVSLNPTGGTYNSGTSVTLVATPSAGYQFNSWSGDVSGTSSTTTITMNSNKNVVANFSTVATGPTTLSFTVSGGPFGYKTLSSNLAQGQRVDVSFIISGGNNDIYVYANNPSNAVVAGSKNNCYYTSGQFSFTASVSGSYNLNFDNTFSALTSKNVQVTITGG